MTEGEGTDGKYKIDMRRSKSIDSLETSNLMFGGKGLIANTYTGVER